MTREEIAYDALITFNERVNMFEGPELEALLHSCRFLRSNAFFFDLHQVLGAPFNDVFDMAGFIVIISRSAANRATYNVTIQVAWRVEGRSEYNRDSKVLQQFVYDTNDGSFSDSLGI